MSGQSEDQTDDAEKDQKSITLEGETIEQLRKAHPHALDDSERIRRAIADSIDMQTAKSVQITRRDKE